MDNLVEIKIPKKFSVSFQILGCRKRNQCVDDEAWFKIDKQNTEDKNKDIICFPNISYINFVVFLLVFHVQSYKFGQSLKPTTFVCHRAEIAPDVGRFAEMKFTTYWNIIASFYQVIVLFSKLTYLIILFLINIKTTT